MAIATIIAVGLVNRYIFRQYASFLKSKLVTIEALEHHLLIRVHLDFAEAFELFVFTDKRIKEWHKRLRSILTVRLWIHQLLFLSVHHHKGSHLEIGDDLMLVVLRYQPSICISMLHFKMNLCKRLLFISIGFKSISFLRIVARCFIFFLFDRNTIDTAQSKLKMKVIMSNIWLSLILRMLLPQIVFSII